MPGPEELPVPTGMTASHWMPRQEQAPVIAAEGSANSLPLRPSSFLPHAGMAPVLQGGQQGGQHSAASAGSACVTEPATSAQTPSTGADIFAAFSRSVGDDSAASSQTASGRTTHGAAAGNTVRATAGTPRRNAGLATSVLADYEVSEYAQTRWSLPVASEHGLGSRYPGAAACVDAAEHHQTPHRHGSRVEEDAAGVKETKIKNQFAAGARLAILRDPAGASCEDTDFVATFSDVDMVPAHRQTMPVASPSRDAALDASSGQCHERSACMDSATSRAIQLPVAGLDSSLSPATQPHAHAPRIQPPWPLRGEFSEQARADLGAAAEGRTLADENPSALGTGSVQKVGHIPVLEAREGKKGDEGQARGSRGLESVAVQMEAKLTVLEAGHDMHADLRFDLRRQDLLRICRQSAPQDTCDGARAVGSDLALRDMHVLQSKSEPTVLVRRGVILVSLDQVKAMITAERLYVLVPDATDAHGALEPVRVRLHAAARQRMKADDGSHNVAADVAFEFAALEVIFQAAAAIKRQEVAAIAADAKDVLSSVRRSLSSRLLKRVLALKKRLAELLTAVSGCRSAFEGSQEDELMALMYLTALKANTAIFDARVRAGSWNTDEVELLLDSYEQEMATLHRQLKQLDHEIESTEALLKLKLDTARNNLIKVDVSFGVAALWLSACSLISAYYGMNLVNGHEQDVDFVMGAGGPSRMWLEVVLISAGASSALLVGTLLMLWCAGLFQS